MQIWGDLYQLFEALDWEEATVFVLENLFSGNELLVFGLVMVRRGRLGIIISTWTD